MRRASARESIPTFRTADYRPNTSSRYLQPFEMVSIASLPTKRKKNKRKENKRKSEEVLIAEYEVNVFGWLSIEEIKTSILHLCQDFGFLYQR
jgi:hypothetical protein